MEKHTDYSFDNEFKNVENLKYFPLVGKSFNNFTKGERILIVAESVYNWGDNDEKQQFAKKSLESSDFVREMVLEQGLYFHYKYPEFKNKPLVRNIERLIFNKTNVIDKEKETFWTSIAFHEFVQRPMKNKNERPNKVDFQIGAKVLLEVIKLLNIDVCIFLGTEYNKFTSIDDIIPVNMKTRELPSDKINGSCPKIIKIKENETIKTTILFIKHPSQRFSWNLWNKFIVKYFPNYSNFIQKLISI